MRKLVKRFGTGAHVVLPVGMVGKTVEVKVVNPEKSKEGSACNGFLESMGVKWEGKRMP